MTYKLMRKKLPPGIGRRGKPIDPIIIEQTTPSQSHTASYLLPAASVQPRKILIVSSFVPFVSGGGTLIVDWLNQAFKNYGYQSEILYIPFTPNYATMLEEMLAFRLFDIGHHADRVVAIRTPSYLIRHPNKIVWFIHHHRGAYDLLGTPFQTIPNTPEGWEIRNSIVQADNAALREARKVFTNSKLVSARLMAFNQVSSEVLYPPLPDAEGFFCGESGNYIFYPSRVNSHKRQYLAVQAMKYTKSEVRLIIAGRPESIDDFEQLQSIIRKDQLDGKVQIIPRWITEEEKIQLYAHSLGCAYIPLEEDSYGFVSLESYYSKKPVVTCYDSGGTLEIVEDGITGRIVAPDPIDIAAAFDDMFNNKVKAIRMGQEGYARLSGKNITWDHVVRRLAE